MYCILNNDQYRKILLSSRIYHHQRLYLKLDGVDVSDSGGAVDLLKGLISKPLALILCYDCLNWYQRMYLATGVTIRENITCVSDLLCFYFIPLLNRNTTANVGKGITWPDHVSSTPEHFCGWLKLSSRYRAETAEFGLCRDSWWPNLGESNWPHFPVLSRRLPLRPMHGWWTPVRTDPPTPARSACSSICSSRMSRVSQSSTTLSSLTGRWDSFLNEWEINRNLYR